MNTDFSDIINLGQIEFTNCLPINFCFEKWNFKNINLINTYPSKINELMIEEKIDIAPISSIEYLKNKDKFVLFDNICISSNGKVKSVVLFSKFDLKNLENKTIGVPYTSATSIILLKVLLDNYGIDLNKVNFIIHDYSKSLNDYLNNQFDAILYIGDKALQEMALENRYKIFDLGDEWKKLTDLPMVFGTWVATKNWQIKHQKDFLHLKELFNKAIDDGLNIYFNEIVSNASISLNVDKQLVENYLKENIKYTYTKKHGKALELFNDKYLEIKRKYEQI